MKFDVSIESWPIAGDGFTISRETKRSADVVIVRLEHEGFAGTGEAVPLKRYGHTTDAIRDEINTWCHQTTDWSRDTLQHDMKAGSARNALDCALWHLAWQHSGLGWSDFFQCEQKVLPTAFTLSGAAPDIMADMAKAHPQFRWLKLKLMGDGLDAARVAAIHEILPDKELIVDANEALTPESLQDLLPIFEKNKVVLIEQPLPAGNDDFLAGFQSPIPFAADESCHTIADLEKLQGKYAIVNLKLDKTGGLTHAMAMTAEARKKGFQVMIGCMASTSLAIMPACVIAQQAAYIDLDGALLLQKDRPGCPISYDSGQVFLL